MSEVLELSHGARLAVRCPNLVPCALLPSHQTHTSPPRDQHVLKKTRTLLPSLGDLSELALQGGG